MKLKLEARKIDWWFWAITLIFIVFAVSGWDIAYNIVIIISAIQIIYFAFIQKSIFSFDTQVRIVYFAFTLTGLSATLRLPFYILLLIGTIMVVFWGRCGIALVLRKMPWNKENMFCLTESDKH